MALDIYLATDASQTLSGLAPHVAYEDEVAQLLHELAQHLGVDDSLLWGLDPYAETTISAEQIPNLIALCESLLGGVPDGDEWHQVRAFLGDMRELCHHAIREGKPLLAIGD